MKGRLFVFLALLFILWGCNKPPKVNLALEAVYIVPHKTSKNQVLKLLGKPFKVKKVSSSKEVWIYREKNQKLVIVIKNSKVVKRYYDETE